MPEINASLFNGAYLDNAFPGTGSQSDGSFVRFIVLFSCIHWRLTINF
jgi:hypothetical protein